MSHQLIRLKSKLCNTPHLIDESTFETVINYLNSRNEGLVDNIKAESSSGQSNSRYSYNSDMQAAVMTIEGPTTYKPVTLFGMDCGGFSYQSWKEDFLELAESGVKTVALMLNSGGGEAFQCFDSARYVRSIADQYGINLISYVDGSACSAAYAIASISDEIIMSNGSQVGSIGVLISLINDSKALEMQGYERTYVTYGGQKVPVDKDGNFRQEFLDDLDYKVGILGKEFTEFVSENRNMTVQAVIDTQAKTFVVKDAIELGLADKQMTIESFFDYLAEVAESNMKGDNILFGKNKLFNKSSAASAQALTTTTTTNEVTEDMEVKELQAQLTAVQTELVASQEAFTALTQAHEMFAEKAAEEKASLEAAVSEAKELVASLEADKVQTKLEGRKASLAKFVPAATAEQLSATFASLDDAAFEVVLGSYSLKHVQESNSELLEELGEQGEPDESQPTALVDKIKQSTRQHIIK